jgi:hypothetical protein
MTYSELQKALKEKRDVQGYTLLIKLNAKKTDLQAEYDRITSLDNDSSKNIAQPELNGQSTELTSAVRLPQVLDLQWFAYNYSCALPSSSIGTSTDPTPQQESYWESWQESYNKALDRLKKPALPSFAATVLTIASIFLDCFASMYKAVVKTVSKRRKKAIGFGV